MSNTLDHLTDEEVTRFLQTRSTDPELGLLDEIVRTVGATPQDRPWLGLRPISLPRRTLMIASIALLLTTMGAVAVGSGLLVEPSPAEDPSVERFDSTVHGISIDYRAGWQTRPATEPWSGGELSFDSPAADVIFDPALGDRLYLVVASQPYGDLSQDAWRDGVLAWTCTGEGMAFGSWTVDGADAFVVTCPSTASAALISTDTRGYLIRGVVSSDEPGLVETYDWDWLKPVLETVDLRPEEALDAPSPSPSPSEHANVFPTELFAGLGDGPVSDELAAELQAVLNDMADGAGISATVMSADGTWSGATGKADGVRDVTVDDQFAIASVTKSVVAAQVMQMVEAGELGLDDTASDHLPPDLDFDPNGATIRQLLGHRSGLPGIDPALFDPALQESPSADRQRVWTPAEMLELVLPDRNPPGQTFEYANTNYLLLGLVIEQVRGRPIAEVLRDGVLSIEGVERLIYQPDETPTEPMAMPFGGSTDVLEEGGGYLPSLAGASVDGAAAAMASDSPALARWWRAFCAGEIVSQTSLAEMTTMHDGYGLGLYEPDPPGTVGHGGEHVGYMSLAGCVPEQGVVVVVLSNDMIDTSAVAEPLVDAVSD